MISAMTKVGGRAGMDNSSRVHLYRYSKGSLYTGQEKVSEFTRASGRLRHESCSAATGRMRTSLVDADLPTFDGGHRGGVEHCSRLVVVHDDTRGVIPDAHPQLVDTGALVITVVGRQHEVVAAGAVHRAGPAVRGLGAGDDHPVVARRVEVEVAGAEPERGGS